MNRDYNCRKDRHFEKRNGFIRIPGKDKVAYFCGSAGCSF